MTTLETPRGGITIRPGDSNDAEAFRALRLQALKDHPEAFGSDYERSAAHPLDFWRERLRPTPHGCYFLAWHEDQLVGIVAAHRDEGPKLQHNCGVYSVYVHHDWRGLGIIDALIDACVAWARGQGAKILRLSVNARNAAAVRAYLRCGFTVYGVEPMLLYVDGVYYDELLMSRLL